MKRVLALVLGLLLLGMAAFAEDMDLTGFSDDELNGLERAIAAERNARAESASAKAGAEEAAKNASEFETLQRGSASDSVRSLQEKLKEFGFAVGLVDGVFGPKTEVALKGLQELMGMEATGVIKTAEELNIMLSLKKGDGVNLAADTSDGWSEWMTPKYNVDNSLFVLGYAYLGDKKVGDYYTCQLEVEFKDVVATEGQQFRFFANGPVDDSWETPNIWNAELVRVTEAPKNGVYKYTKTVQITDKNVNSKKFRLGCRCDYWAGGSFRVRKIKVEAGMLATDWTPAP